jgi:outer membrane protein W
MIRQLAAVCLGLGVWGASSTALAQTDSGLALGLRVGYAIPMGKAGAVPSQTGAANTRKDGLPDTVTGMVPLWFDVGYRLNPALYLGAFFQYGFAFVNKDNVTGCDQGISCSAHDISFGANLHYHILPDAPFDPWLGVGFGYEFLTGSESGSVVLGGQNITIDGSTTLKGFQFLVLEAGGDFKATPALAVGPFVNFALGKYATYSSSVTLSSTSQDRSGDVQDSGLHEWLTFGLRGQYNL